MNISSFANSVFEENNLSYQDITMEDLYLLIKFINKEIASKDTHLITMLMPLKKDVKFSKNGCGLKSAILYASGSYFSRREVVSFYSNNEIYLARWADDENIQPILQGFTEWCQFLKHVKEGD